MTRFARAKGSKASNERVCEEATSWEEMKSQLLNKKLEIEEKEKREEAEKKRNANYQQFLKDRNEQKSNSTEWSEFPSSCSIGQKKRKNDNKSGEENSNSKKKRVKENVSTFENDSGIDMNVFCKKPINKKGSETTVQNEKCDSDAPEECTSKTEITQPQVKKPKNSKKKLKIVIESENEPSVQPDVEKKSKKVLKKEIDLESLPDNEKLKVLKKQERRKKQIEKKLLKKKLKQEELKDQQNEEKKSSVDDSLPNQNTRKKIDKSDRGRFEKPLRKTGLNVDNKVKTEKKQKTKKDGKGEFKRRKEYQCDTQMINGKEVMIEYYDGFPIKKEDAKNLKKLRSEMISKGLPRSEINRTLKLERRKAEKALAREKKKVCFNCRKFGHNLSECPEISAKNNELIESAGTGICFKCGSTEHTSFVCRVVQGQNFKFATCFICKEQGHISRQCPDNGRGLYPKGGACRVCGDVTHLKKDCPKFQIQQERENDKFKVETFEGGNPDNFGYDEKSNNETMNVKSNKIIKF